MSLNSSGIVNSDEGGLHLMVKTDEIKAFLTLLPRTLFHSQQAVDLSGEGKMHGQGILIETRPVKVILI